MKSVGKDFPNPQPLNLGVRIRGTLGDIEGFRGFPSTTKARVPRG